MSCSSLPSSIRGTDPCGPASQLSPLFPSTQGTGLSLPKLSPPPSLPSPCQRVVVKGAGGGKEIWGQSLPLILLYLAGLL